MPTREQVLSDISIAQGQAVAQRRRARAAAFSRASGYFVYLLALSALLASIVAAFPLAAAGGL